jgi:mRNA deadenylase 3'-5' endonuclease subunit Ccr4
MKILSWNILADEFIKKRYYPMIPSEVLLNRKQRQIQIISTLVHADMDVMLLQEVDTLWREYLELHILELGYAVHFGDSWSSGLAILWKLDFF